MSERADFDREARIAELERQNGELRAKLEQEIARAVAGRDDLLGVVAHDLRNMVAVVLLSLRELLKTIPTEERRKRGRRQLEAIQRSADRMMRLTRDLSDTLAVQTGQLSIDPRPTQLALLAAEVIAAFEPQAAAAGLRLDRQVPAEDAQVIIDHDRILQLFSHLLSNAQRVTPRGGTVTLQLEVDGVDLRGSVADTGPGIAAENREQIFRRPPAQPKAERTGLGVGLSIARGIVEAHGGKLWVESVIGRGSRFAFVLPGARRAAEPT